MRHEDAYKGVYNARHVGRSDLHAGRICVKGVYAFYPFQYSHEKEVT